MSYYVILKKTDMRMYIVLKDGEEINKIKNTLRIQRMS